MERNRPTPEDILLDLHLGRLDEADRALVEAELTRDAQLRTRSERLGRILRPLDQFQPAGAPTNLAERVLAYVDQSAGAANSTIPFPAQVRGAGRAPFARWREWIAVAACLALLAGTAGPGLSSIRGRAQKAMCASNLGSIFRGASAYQEMFAGSLPYAGGFQNASWLPDADRTAPFASNSRHPYLLIKLKLGPKPKDFLCPGESAGQAMPDDGCDRRADFVHARSVSYDSLNLAGASPNLRPAATLAYMSDTNPLFVGARFNAALDPARANSPAHRGKGQTVLRLDGSAAFLATPVYAANGDNLWTITDVKAYRGNETTTRTDDAFLVPGCPSGEVPPKPTH